MLMKCLRHTIRHTIFLPQRTQRVSQRTQRQFFVPFVKPFVSFVVKIQSALCALLFAAGCATTPVKQGGGLDWIGLSKDGTTLVEASSGKPFLMWGVNYDRDTKSRLMDDYWMDEWDTVVEDFDEMKALGLNTVRIHLQVGHFMDSPTQPNAKSLAQLKKLIRVAESRGLYLYVTGLACYKKENIPEWYDNVTEKERWAIQSEFWKAVARVCKDSPAVLCYDLMNEPCTSGDTWLPEEGFGGFFYVQYLTRTPDGRDGHTIAKAWVDTLADAIRTVDTRHLVTVGVIPWATVWPDAKPVFYNPVVAEKLDFASVHFYPKGGEVEKTLRALAVYQIGKPLVIAEMFPMECGIEDMDAFIEGSRPITQGWLSFYWGKTIEEYAQEATLGDQWLKAWLEYYRDKGKSMVSVKE